MHLADAGPAAITNTVLSQTMAQLAIQLGIGIRIRMGPGKFSLGLGI